VPAAPAVEVAPGVFRIPLAPSDLVNAYAIKDGDGQVTLVDCGLKRAPRRIVAALDAVGSHSSEVTRIVLTHAHPDHAGGLARMRGLTGASVATHEREAPYVRQGRVPARDQQFFGGRLLTRLPDRFAPTEVSEEFHDGDSLPVAGGLRVVHTPGHTPGHVSLLHEPSGVLVTGDAIFNVRRLRWPPKMFCTDFTLTRQTAERLSEIEFEVAAFTHGPEIRESAREAVRGFVRTMGVTS
jgi:glyoxylase-like metal-dependent hydrolase (beta-lactamase superfamily II)